MEKRYQVFVSSTYADLQDERQRVIQTLMEMDCIPSGMEMFPASDEEQFDFIKRVIDDCDYYLLIIGGRYGSTTSEGISYTEKEYHYAIDKGIKVIAFLHREPDSIVAGKTDKDPELALKLIEFREKVQTGRLVRFWKEASELPGLVSLSLQKTIKTYPAIGWIRATNAGSTELLHEINLVRKENEELRTRLLTVGSCTTSYIENIADMEDKFLVNIKYQNGSREPWKHLDKLFSWNDLFSYVAPKLLERPSDAEVEVLLRKSILDSNGINYFLSKITDQDFQTIKIQFKSYGLIELQYKENTDGGGKIFWNLTERGEEKMIELRTIRKKIERRS